MLMNVLPQRTRSPSKAQKVNDALCTVILLVQTEKTPESSALLPNPFPRPLLFKSLTSPLFIYQSGNV